MISVTKLVNQLGMYKDTAAVAIDDLITRARSGDEEAFRLIFVRYSRPVISFIYDMVGEKELAQELTQETFLRAYRNLSAMEDESKLSTWLFGIAKNVAREALRRRRKENLHIKIDDLMGLSDEQSPPEAALLSKELNGVIQRALTNLDEDKRLVFTLKVFHQRSYEEIAEVTGFSIAKLKTDLYRAKAEMRTHLISYLGESNEV